MNKTKDKNFLAIEFASSAVKLVQMKQVGDRFRLLKVQSVPIDLSNNPQIQSEALQKAIEDLLSGEPFENHTLIFSTNSPHICFSQFILPKIPKKELVETLKWKMKEEMPFSPEEAFFDFRLFKIKESKEGKQFATLVTAIPKDVADRFLKILPTQKFASVVHAFVPFSILEMPNAFWLSKQELVVIVDIGSDITEVAFYEEGRLSFLRKIAYGGETLTRALIQPLTTEKGLVLLTKEEAEHAKCEENLLDPKSQKLIAGKIEASKLHALIRPELEKLCGELERSFDYYAQEHGNSVKQIFLTGGASRLTGLAQLLSQKFEISVNSIDLTKDIEFSETIQVKDLDLYHRLMSLILDRKDTSVSPLFEVIRSLDRVSRSISYKQTAAVVTGLFLVLLVGMFWRYQDALQKTENLNVELSNLNLGYGEAQKIQDIETQITKGKLLISAALVREPYWEEVFRELAHVFPEEVTLSQVSYEENSVLITGHVSTANSETSVSELLQAMTGSVFQKITLVNSEQKGNLVHFTVRCEVI